MACHYATTRGLVQSIPRSYYASEIIGVVLRCDHSVGRVQPIRTCRDLVTPDRSSTYPCAHGAARAYTPPNGDIRTRANADGDACAHPRAYSIACGHTHAYSNAPADADPGA